MSESIKDATVRKYDGTVARVAGNIFSGIAERIVGGNDTERASTEAVRFCVRHARLIVAETRRTESEATPNPEVELARLRSENATLRAAVRAIDIGDGADYFQARQAVARLSGLPVFSETFDGHVAVVANELAGLRTGGIGLIARERTRQSAKEGWTPAHDDQHETGELATAAAVYALHHTVRRGLIGWPWDLSWFKPKGPIADLTRAGALIAAEIDRLLRKQQ